MKSFLIGLFGLTLFRKVFEPIGSAALGSFQGRFRLSFQCRRRRGPQASPQHKFARDSRLVRRAARRENTGASMRVDEVSDVV